MFDKKFFTVNYISINFNSIRSKSNLEIQKSETQYIEKK